MPNTQAARNAASSGTPAPRRGPAPPANTGGQEPNLPPISEESSFAGQSARTRKDELIQQITQLMQELNPKEDVFMKLVNQNSTNLTERRR